MAFSDEASSSQFGSFSHPTTSTTSNAYVGQDDGHNAAATIGQEALSPTWSWNETTHSALDTSLPTLNEPSNISDSLWVAALGFNAPFPITDSMSSLTPGEQQPASDRIWSVDRPMPNERDISPIQPPQLSMPDFRTVTSTSSTSLQSIQLPRLPSDSTFLPFQEVLNRTILNQAIPNHIPAVSPIKPVQRSTAQTPLPAAIAPPPPPPPAQPNVPHQHPTHNQFNPAIRWRDADGLQSYTWNGVRLPDMRADSLWKYLVKKVRVLDTCDLSTGELCEMLTCGWPGCGDKLTRGALRKHIKAVHQGMVKVCANPGCGFAQREDMFKSRHKRCMYGPTNNYVRRIRPY